MAYEKIEEVVAVGSEEPALIAFHYTVEELFNINSLWSMYKAVHKIDAKGENMVDDLAITEDERDIFLSILSDGVFDVFNRFLKYTKGVVDAILFNEDYTPSGGTSAKSVVVKIVDHESYNTNYLRPIDKVLEKAVRFYVLKEWFSMKDLDADEAKAALSYARNINSLLKHSMQLKKASITL